MTSLGYLMGVLYGDGTLLPSGNSGPILDVPGTPIVAWENILSDTHITAYNGPPLFISA